MGAEMAERTFSFVDLAGFTALTEAHGDLDAVELLDRFTGLVRASLSADDELVKSIGDAVMLASPEPGAAVAMLAGLCPPPHSISHTASAGQGHRSRPGRGRDSRFTASG